jgi:hypothetical protein
MSNKIKLENLTQAVGLTLSSEPVLISNPDAKYVYTQGVASDTWVITHNLNKYCSVTVVDDNKDVVMGEIHYDSVNQVTLTFTASFTGQAYLN